MKMFFLVPLNIKHFVFKVIGQDPFDFYIEFLFYGHHSWQTCSFLSSAFQRFSNACAAEIVEVKFLLEVKNDS